MLDYVFDYQIKETWMAVLKVIELDTHFVLNNQMDACYAQGWILLHIHT